MSGILRGPDKRVVGEIVEQDYDDDTCEITFTARVDDPEMVKMLGGNIIKGRLPSQ